MDPLARLVVDAVLILLVAGAIGAWAVRVLPRRRGSAGLLRVVAHLELEPRRALYVIETTGQYLLVGSGEGGLQVLRELDGKAVEQQLAAGAQAVGGLARLLGRERRP